MMPDPVKYQACCCTINCYWNAILCLSIFTCTQVGVEELSTWDKQSASESCWTSYWCKARLIIKLCS